jgi:mannose-1-phosphate guanylyltransferase/mannose-1-phosphate guanylyltransferase/mannose-6-phosphate isomerase
MLVCPSDHHIADPDAFRAAALAAAELARQDYLVSFGIAADRPETGYGYVELDRTVAAATQSARTATRTAAMPTCRPFICTFSQMRSARWA